MKEPKRVVLVEPGDLLLIGNIGDFDVADLDSFKLWIEKVGVEVAMFPARIQLDVLKAAERG